MSTLTLPRGITGFAPGESPHTPATSLRAFNTVCHAVARQLHGRVVSVTGCGGRVTPNFHVAELRLRSGVYFVLCNAYHPWLAATAEPPTWMEGTFLPSAELSSAAESTSDFSFLQPDQLEQPLTLEALRALGPGELGQLLYWKPKRLGDVIFNFWD
ncbi:hypothetical protein [Deinococcus altitudinis]|uniref:hypothetical protein n=1 Tax=Deinococcus altitudinis TaxID=468914 RepID=UPI003892B9EC